MRNYTTQEKKDVTEYVAKMYSHILFGLGEVSGKRFADEIRQCFLMTESRHRVCAEFAEKYIESIYFNPNGITRVKFNFSTLK